MLSNLGYQISAVLAIEALLIAKEFPFENYKHIIYTNPLNTNQNENHEAIDYREAISKCLSSNIDVNKLSMWILK